MPNFVFNNYKKAVIENFKFLKVAENLRDAFLRAVPIQALPAYY